MNKERYSELYEKLSDMLSVGGFEPSVSPMLGPDGATVPSGLFIAPNMDLDRLDDSKIHLVHTLLHQFYAKGGNKSLSMEEIEDLHSKVKIKIKHPRFDKLDK